MLGTAVISCGRYEGSGELSGHYPTGSVICHVGRITYIKRFQIGLTSTVLEGLVSQLFCTGFDN